ncbi:hypothetical protein GF406_00455, partial [candidate division KSB1 bacterium]|nr:hypothetical protein [candidate division KSB1 bacterium]
MRQKILKKRYTFRPLLGTIILLLLVSGFSDMAIGQVKTTLIKVGRFWASASDGGSNTAV